MKLESLLVSRDADVIRVVRPTLEKLGVDVEICQQARTATDMLICEKFDAVIVDSDDLDGGLEILQGLRATSGNRNSVSFAILNGRKTTTQQAFAMGANFVLQKPISELNASRCFNAALNFIMQERRRYFRYPVKMLVKLVIGTEEWTATSTNISEGGMALQLHKALPKGALPNLQFTLPGTTAEITVDAALAWVNIKGSAGLRFGEMTPGTRETLQQWLNHQVEKDLPLNPPTVI